MALSTTISVLKLHIKLIIFNLYIWGEAEDNKFNPCFIYPLERPSTLN